MQIFKYLYYMKIWDIVKEDFDGKQQMDEGAKENLMAVVFSVASMFGGLKAQDKLPSKTDISVTQTINKDSSLKLDMGKLFKSGKYIFNQSDSNKLASELKILGTKIAENPNANFVIEVISSESRVPNYDAEPSSPTYKKQLSVGQLAEKRAETAMFILKKFTDELKNEGVLMGDVKFVLPPTVRIGDVPWPSVDPSSKRELTKDDSLYTKDQYVYANIKILPKTIDRFEKYSDMGEGIYVGDKLYGFAFFATRKTKDKKVAGTKNTGYENVLFKMVKPNKAVSGKKNAEGDYIGTYIIPWSWWNENVHYKRLTPQNIEDLKQFEVH